MKVNSNIQGMIAQGILSKNEEQFAKSTQKLASGYKINRAMDNPAGMAISNKMRAQLKSLDRANKNANNGRNVCQIADGALGEIHDMLQRMNELAIQASNGTMTDYDRKAVNDEVTQLCNEISRISSETDYNTKRLLNGSHDLKGYSSQPDDIKVRNYNTDFDLGKYSVTVDGTGNAVLTNITDPANPKVVDTTSEITTYYEADGVTVAGFSTKLKTSGGGELVIDTYNPAGGNADLDISGMGGMKIQVGAEQKQEIQIVIPTISLKHLGLGDLENKQIIDCTTPEKAKKGIDMVKEAISYVSAARSKVGAYQNRLENTISNLDVTYENLTESYSTIKDLDMAQGMVEYTTLQILMQAGTSMLAQANEQPQQALQLLQ